MIKLFERPQGVRSLLLMSVLVISGCATDEPYITPKFAFSDHYRAAPQARPVAVADGEWWVNFRDPTLNKLVTLSLDRNLSLDLARERVIEARANVDTLAPLFSVTPSASANVTSTPTAGTVTQANASLNFSWLLDPYGMHRQQVQVATAQSEAVNAELDAARLLVILNVTNAYVDLRYYQRMMDLRQQQLRSRQSAVTLTQRLFDAGAATKLELVQTQALLAETKTQIPALSAAILSSKNQIAVLTGVSPDRLDVSLKTTGAQPRPAAQPDLGVPADLLRNRPDIQIAELNYYSAVADIGVARSGLYPSLSLSGVLGQLLVGGVAGPQLVFGPAIDFPSFPTKAGKAAVSVRESRARQTHSIWKSTVLDALEEVESSFATYQGSQLAVREAADHVRLQREARDLTRDLVEQQNITVRELVDAEADVADADVLLAENIRTLARNYIQVQISLGAGSQVGRAPADPVMMPEELIRATAGD